MREDQQPFLKNLEEEAKKNTSMLGIIRGAFRVSAGIVLGVVTISVAAVRSSVGFISNAVLGLGGGVATFAAAGAHLVNFMGFQAKKGIYKMMGKDTSNLNVNSTKEFLKRAANFTERKIEGAFSTPYEIFSGKRDEQIKKDNGLKDIPNTYSTFIKSIQLMMAMSPEERKNADMARSGNIKKSNSRERS